MMESMWGVLVSLQAAIAGTKATAASSGILELQMAGRLTRRQLLGVFASVSMSLIVVPSVVYEFLIIGVNDWNLRDMQGAMLRNSILQSLDALANIIAAVVLSGGLKTESTETPSPWTDIAAKRHRLQGSVWFSRSYTRSLDDPWMAKVAELAGRGISLRHLLEFYEGLGKRHMLHYSAKHHTTADVVRQAIIPLTRAALLTGCVCLSCPPVSRAFMCH